MDGLGTMDTLEGSTLFRHTFNWQIPHISRTHNQLGYPQNISLTSPIFTTPYLNQKIQWRLKIDLTGYTYKLNLECFANTVVKANIMIKVMDCQACNRTCTFQKEGFVYVGENPSSEKIYGDHSLNISCQITFDSKSIETYFHHEGLQDFEKLLESGNMSDVTFVVDGKEIHAHKVILSSRSPVFQAMFEHDMMEKKENIVKIEGISFEVMKELLRYIYACSVDGIEKIAKELLAAADKYCVSDLYSLCEIALINGLTDLSVDNAIENLILATTYKIPNFKTEVMKFIIRNLKDVMKTPQFSSLNPDILRSLLAAIAQMKIEIPLCLDCSS